MVWVGILSAAPWNGGLKVFGTENFYILKANEMKFGQIKASKLKLNILQIYDKNSLAGVKISYFCLKWGLMN